MTTYNVYLVGGAVRDHMLKQPVHDRDWVVVGAHPDQLLAEGFLAVGKSFPVFLHPKTHEEYALARQEFKTGAGYNGFSCYSGQEVTLEEDLKRRDLTINAMALDQNGRLIDPYGGYNDLTQGWLRHVSDAFAEDPLRILRIARFWARYQRLGFRIHPDTLQLMVQLVKAKETQALVPERITQETSKALNTPAPDCFFCGLTTCGALADIFPELINLNTTPALWQQWLSLLRLSAQRALTIEGRWALVAWGLHHESSSHRLWRQLANRLRLTKSAKQLGQCLLNSWQAYQNIHNVHDVVDWCDSNDGWRKPWRIIELWRVLQLVSPITNPWHQRLPAVLWLARNVRLDPPIQGKQAGHALHLKRHRIMAQWALAKEAAHTNWCGGRLQKRAGNEPHY